MSAIITAPHLCYGKFSNDWLAFLVRFLELLKKYGDTRSLIDMDARYQDVLPSAKPPPGLLY